MQLSEGINSIREAKGSGREKWGTEMKIRYIVGERENLGVRIMGFDFVHVCESSDNVILLCIAHVSLAAQMPIK